MGLTKLLFVVASVVIIAVVMVLSLNAILHRPIKLRNSVSFLINESALISINAPIYVVGPQSLVQELIGVGVNQSLIRPVSLSELPYLPGDSLVIIDWSFIKPGLLVNEDGIVSVNVDSMVFKFVEGLVRRGDFVIIHGNSSDIPIIEYALALAWSRAFNTSIIAMPIPKYLSNLNYVVAFGNDRVLVIGPHTLTSALEIANNLWLPIIMKGQVVNLTDDLCTELVQEYESLMANQSVIQYMAYAIIYGEQNYNGPFGTASVDFCMSWMPIIDQDYNGHVVGYAQFYDYIRYISSPAVTINYLGSFQDAYASYITYEWEKGRNISLPGDTLFVAGSGNGYEPGYWTDVVDFSPGSLICTKSMTYVVSMNIFYHLGFNVPIASQSYVCSKAMISLFSMGGAASDGFGVINATWYYKPYLANVTEATLAVEGGGFTPVGTAYVPRPTAYTVPISVFAKLSAGHCGLFDLFTRHVYVSYYLDWLVWINVTSLFGRPGRLPIYYSHGILSSGNYTSNGFYIEAQCG